MFDPLNLATLDEWLDENVSERYKLEPLAQDWARISKIGEEYGEVVDAFIGITGQNPRKGVYGTSEDVNNELIDVALTALLALQHRTKSYKQTAYLVSQRMEYRLKKAGLW